MAGGQRDSQPARRRVAVRIVRRPSIEWRRGAIAVGDGVYVLAYRQASAATAGGPMETTWKPRLSKCRLARMAAASGPTTSERMGLVAGYLVMAVNSRTRSHTACLRQASFLASVATAAPRRNEVGSARSRRSVGHHKITREEKR